MDGPDPNVEPVGDFLIPQVLGDEGENVELAWCQSAEQIPPSGHWGPAEGLHSLGAERRQASERAPDGADQPGGLDGLDKVAASAGPQRQADGVPIAAPSEHHDRHLRQQGSELLGALDAGGAGHRDVHEDHVRRGMGDPPKGFFPVQVVIQGPPLGVVLNDAAHERVEILVIIHQGDAERPDLPPWLRSLARPRFRLRGPVSVTRTYLQFSFRQQNLWADSSGSGSRPSV
jgi:hypothetical protein